MPSRTLTLAQFRAQLTADVARLGMAATAERYDVHRRTIGRVIDGHAPSPKFLAGAGLRVGYINGRGTVRDDAYLRDKARLLVKEHGSERKAAKSIGVVSASLWRLLNGLPPEPGVAVALGFTPIYVSAK